MTTVRKIWWWGLGIKLLLSAFLPMFADEAYYWVWSHHPQLSYYDHPPFVSWLFMAGHLFENWFSFARWPAVIMGHATLWIWILIVKNFLSEGQLKWFVILALLSPLTGPGSLIVTPDIPLVFFASLAIYFFLSFLRAPQASTAAWLGLCLGLGLSSKYLIVLTGLTMLAYVFWRKKYFAFKPIYLLAFVVAFVGASSTVWLWNAQNDWISFKFQTQHGLGAIQWHWSWVLKYVLGQMLLVFPVIGYWAARQPKRQLDFFWLAGWLPLAFFFLSSFRGWVEGNWPLLGYLPLLAVAASRIDAANAKWFKFTLGFWSAGLLFVLIQIWSPSVLRLTPKIRELEAFDSLKSVVTSRSPVYARSYQMAAKLSFETKRAVYKLKGLSRVDFFDSRPESMPPADVKTYYVIVEKEEQLPDWTRHENHSILEKTSLNNEFDLLTIQKP